MFHYRNKGELATIGRSSAVGTIGPRGVRLSGWIAWMAWWSIHIVFLIDFRSRLSVLLNWAWNYLTFQRSARLITGPVASAHLRRCPPGTDPATSHSQTARTSARSRSNVPATMAARIRSISWIVQATLWIDSSRDAVGSPTWSRCRM